MFGLPLAFSAPLVLGALIALPALWYLLRITPPRPKQIAFPPLRLILDLEPKDQQPARTPWWLLALRLLLAALIILAMAGPITWTSGLGSTRRYSRQRLARRARLGQARRSRQRCNCIRRA